MEFSNLLVIIVIHILLQLLCLLYVNYTMFYLLYSNNTIALLIT